MDYLFCTNDKMNTVILGIKIIPPTTTEIREAINTPPAARSFTFLIIGLIVGDTALDSCSMDVLMISAIKTNPIAKMSMHHSMFDTLKQAPSISTMHVAVT